LLIIGVVLIAAFILWEHRLEKNEGKMRPPLMKLSLWGRAKGRFAVIQIIAFLEWSAFLSWYFWAQVRFLSSVPPSATDRLPGILRGLRQAHSCSHSTAAAFYDNHGVFVQCLCDACDQPNRFRGTHRYGEMLRSNRRC
jgi:hypothetical protein